MNSPKNGQNLTRTTVTHDLFDIQKSIHSIHCSTVREDNTHINSLSKKNIRFLNDK